jgi:hypothetical protein
MSEQVCIVYTHDQRLERVPGCVTAAVRAGIHQALILTSTAKQQPATDHGGLLFDRIENNQAEQVTAPKSPVRAARRFTASVRRASSLARMN